MGGPTAVVATLQTLLRWAVALAWALGEAVAVVGPPILHGASGALGIAAVALFAVLEGVFWAATWAFTTLFTALLPALLAFTRFFATEAAPMAARAAWWACLAVADVAVVAVGAAASAVQFCRRMGAAAL